MLGSRARFQNAVPWAAFLAFLVPLQELRDPIPQQFRPFRLTLPYDQNLPPHGPEFPDVLPVSGSVPFELLLPELSASGRPHPAIPAVVPMPEAPVNKDDASSSGKDQVGAPGKVLLMNPMPVTKCGGHSANDHLRPRILAADM